MKIKDNLALSLVLCVLTVPAILGWFFTPFLLSNIIARYSLIFITCLIPLIYFTVLFVYKTEYKFVKYSVYISISFFLIVPFSVAYHHLRFDNYYSAFVIPFNLCASIIFYEIYKEHFISVLEVSKYVLQFIPWICFITGILLLFKTLTNSIIPHFDSLPFERQIFLIFKILYFFIIAIISRSIRSKIIKQNTKGIFELLSLIFFFGFYIISSFYLFFNKGYLNGDYFIYGKEIILYLGLSTLCVYSIILIEKRDYYSNKIQKIYSVSLIIYSIMTFLPIILDLIGKYSLDFSKGIIDKAVNFIVIVITSILGSLVSSLLLKRAVKKPKKLKKIHKEVRRSDKIRW